MQFSCKEHQATHRWRSHTWASSTRTARQLKAHSYAEKRCNKRPFSMVTTFANGRAVAVQANQAVQQGGTPPLKARAYDVVLGPHGGIHSNVDAPALVLCLVRFVAASCVVTVSVIFCCQGPTSEEYNLARTSVDASLTLCTTCAPWARSDTSGVGFAFLASPLSARVWPR